MRVSLPMAFLLLFVGLKLAGKIAWSWWWVTSPLWIPIVLLGMVGVGVCGLFVFAGKSKKAGGR